MDNEGESESATQDSVDNVHHQIIEDSIDKLNFVSLSSFDANKELHSAIDEDAYIISNVVTRIGISKALEHGVKLSSIIKAKALRLNEATALEVLGVVLRTFCNNFADGEEPVQIQSQSNPSDRTLDFTKLSKFFSSRTLGYSPITWDTLPQPAGEQQPQSVKRRRVQPTHTTTTIGPTREVSTMIEYNETLETEKHTESVRHKLLEASQSTPVSFWDFVLDEDPQNGYNNTCRNIYSLTFLTVKGLSTFEKDDNGIKIQGLQDPDEGRENAQGIVTGLSYDTWRKKVEERSKKRRQDGQR
ncbi:hypothetical protein, conserved [Babesia bigemina]|uniref:Uncharacterized protein n=1 Tax=Babesia bigemina TaxID=5866 RepID=A0A061D9J8_BABBI|nr:hypothetical protein, conserved [Babesia bigemina]CDR94395.1 hypothetical protein, conserved [Babesia bigemina]|eukprot:XP_012766581.1 hypothetical protein, conserved [Babesia bigemina]